MLLSGSISWFKKGDNRPEPEEYAELEKWKVVPRNLAKFLGKYMVMRFDLNAALQTLVDYNKPGRQYTVTITGSLGDEMYFRGESAITIVSGKRR